MQKTQHTPEFKEQALAKAYARKTRTIGDLATDLNILPGTLKSWMRDPVRTHSTPLPSAKRAAE